MSFNCLLHNFRSVLAPRPSQRNHRRRGSIRTESHWLRIEILEDRSLLSAVAFGDFNNDGRLDKAAITAPTTITVSMANPDGSYAVSATLTVPKNLPIAELTVSDINADGKLDISSGGVSNNGFYSHSWLGDGDGTFGNRVTQSSRFPKWWV